MILILAIIVNSAQMALGSQIKIIGRQSITMTTKMTLLVCGNDARACVYACARGGLGMAMVVMGYIQVCGILLNKFKK